MIRQFVLNSECTEKKKPKGRFGIQTFFSGAITDVALQNTNLKSFHKDQNITAFFF